MNDISVKVTKYADRKNWVMYFDDPLTGKRETRSTKQVNEREAERAAAKWEAELQEGRYVRKSRIEWSEFRDRFETEVLAGHSESSFYTHAAALKSFERIISPKHIARITAEHLSAYQSQLRDEGKAPATIRTYAKHLRIALAWAVHMGWLRQVPAAKLPIVEEDDEAKGRPLTTEEFERMLAVVPKALAEPIRDVKDKRKWKRKPPPVEVVESWRHLLRGLWLSGLRISEAINLTWDNEQRIHLDLTGRRPLIIFPAKLNKRRKRVASPITPDFFEFLMSVSDEHRTGPVFNPLGLKSGTVKNRDWAGRAIGKIGETAGVVVKFDEDEQPAKYASAHDLRRSFGFRWAGRVLPPVLKELMRHKSIETTLKFYAKSNATLTADAVWNAFKNHPETHPQPEAQRRA